MQQSQTCDRCEVSIIIPVFNGEKTILNCLQSVIGQSFHNLEAIVVDDGSTDCTKEIVEKYMEGRDSILLIHKENGGVSSARNVGMLSASGRYLMFLDADDTIPEKFVEQMYRCAERTEAKISMGNILFLVCEEGRIRKRSNAGLKGICHIKTKAEFTSVFNQMIDNKIFLSVCGKLYRFDYIHQYRIRFDEKIAIGEDLLFNLECFRHSFDIVINGEAEYEYRVSSCMDSASARSDLKKMDNARYLCERGFAFVDDMVLDSITGRAFIKYYYRSVFFQLEKMKKIDGDLISLYFDKAFVSRVLKENVKNDLELFLYKVAAGTQNVMIIKVIVKLRSLFRKAVRG